MTTKAIKNDTTAFMGSSVGLETGQKLNWLTFNNFIVEMI